MTFIYFIIALGLLIFVHELGHFIWAKRAGICVEVFSLGFGKRLIGVKRGDTDYRISMLPLGGYIKMKGEDPDDEDAKTDPRSFAAKSVWSRAKVILFGPLMNLFLCMILMPIVFMIGRAEPVFLTEPPVIENIKKESPAASAGLKVGDKIVAIDGEKVETWEGVLNKILLSPGQTLDFEFARKGKTIDKRIDVGELPEIKGGYVGVEPMLFLGSEAIIDGIRPQGPADEAGIEPGDRVVAFNGTPVDDWFDLASKVNENKGIEAKVTIDRDGKRMSKFLTPEYSKDYDRWLIGISKDTRKGVPMTIRRYGFFEAIVQGQKENIKLLGLTFDVLKRLVTLKLSYKVLGGPIIIAKTSAAAASSGLASFIYFLAFLSLQLGILNFLPIPVLDGGHLVFLGIEAIRKKPVSERIRGIANQVGFVVLVSLMVLVTFNDIENVWGIKTIIKKLF